MKNFAGNKTSKIRAFSLKSQPSITDFTCGSKILTIEFDHSILEKKQIAASEIEELCDLVEKYEMPNYPVIFCDLDDLRGCVFLEGEIEWPLIFMDIGKLFSVKEMRETYIHEAAHLFSYGCGHDFVFSIIHNIFLRTAGYDFSEIEYEYRDCDCGLTLSESMLLSKECVKILLDNKLDRIFWEDIRDFFHYFPVVPGDTMDDKLAVFKRVAGRMLKHLNSSNVVNS